jgi:hypothetical protein
MNILLLLINIIALSTIYFLNETIANLQKENSKLIGIIQNLNNELQSEPDIDINTNIILSFLGVLSITVIGLTILLFLKNDTVVVGELSKNSIQATGDYVKEIIVPSVDLLNKSSEARVIANIDNVKNAVAETGTILTKHISEVNREGVICLVNTIKPPVAAKKVLGHISRELLHLIP